MTVEEFVKAFEKLCKQLDNKDKYSIFCLLDNEEEGMFKVLGHCCPGCIAEKIAINLDNFSHLSNEKDVIH